MSLNKKYDKIMEAWEKYNVKEANVTGNMDGGELGGGN